MINKLLVAFPSMCDLQLFTLRKKIYLVLASSSSDGQVSAPPFVTHHGELTALNKHLA